MVRVRALRNGVIGIAACVSVCAAVAAQPALAACDTGTVTFAFTRGEQCYVVPSGVTAVQITATGAPGANWGSAVVLGR